MKIARIGQLGQEKPALILEDGSYVDVSSIVPDISPQSLDDGALAKLSTADLDALPRLKADTRIGSPLARPGKIICIGLNYAKHAAEGGMAVPEEPVVFFKATTALTGPNDGLVIPKNSTKTDWEVELAFVIGKTCRHATLDNAMDYVLGYCVHNDWSERAWQLEGAGQWVKGKSADTYAPLGPFIATTDEITNPHNLGLWLEVNGERLQDSNTDDFIFNIPEVIVHLSQYMTLEAGDVISTGTPAGVGLGQKPPRYIKPGDVVELGIEGLGSQKQVARSYEG
jgi:2,4-didehydro-3-deoxy-L-rhamnonate hydrolase